METTSNVQSIPWLRPLVELLNKREFEEAFELGEYLPETTERKLVQCAVLVAINKFKESETLLRGLSLDIPQIAPFISTVFSKGVDFLLTMAIHAIDEGYLLTGHLFFESYLCKIPNPGSKALIALKRLSGIALRLHEYDLGLDFINRNLQINNSPDQLLKCAEIVLINRSSEFAENLLVFSKNLIDQALDKLDDDNIELRIKAAKLLAMGIKTFDEAGILIREVLKLDLSKKEEISNLLLPLIDSKSNFSEIADLLIDIEPANIFQITNELFQIFLHTKNSIALEKAKLLLGKIDYIESGYVQQFADALLTVASHVEDFELYAKKILDYHVEAKTFLKFAGKLIGSESNNLFLASKFVDKAFLGDSSLKISVIRAYFRLAKLCEKKGEMHLRDAIILKAANLSNDLTEFLENGFDSLLKRVKAIFDYEEILTSRNWFKKDEKLSLAIKLIQKSKGISYFEREEIQKFLLGHFKEIKEDQNRITKVLTGDKRFRMWKLHRFYLSVKKSQSKDSFLEEVYELGYSAKEERFFKKEKSFSKIERYTRIEFPTECELEKKAELKIQLMKNVPVLTRVLKKISVKIAKNKKEIIFDAHVTAPGFAIEQKSKSMKVPVDADSEELIFSLYPAERGEKAIEIEFFCNSLRVGYVIVKTYVGVRESSESISDAITMEYPMVNFPKEDFANINRRTIHVSWNQREEKIYYKIYSVNPNECGEGVQESPGIKNDIESYLRDLNGFLTEIVNRASPPEKDWDSINLNMKGYGKNLFEKLLPPIVAEQTRKWEKGSTVIISTNEQWVPWELLHDSDDFLGKKFILARCPRLSDHGNIPDTSRKKSDSSNLSDGIIINVVGGDIPKTETDKAIDLFNKFSLPVPVKVLEQEPVSILEKSLAQANTLHCTCHGHLNPPMLQVAKDKSRYNNLLIETVNALSLNPGCFVFANACSSSAPVIKFGKFSNFGWEFYRCGADIFIGTLGAVPAKYAVQFAESVYKEIFYTGSKPRTIGQAIANAKKEAENNRNLFWLLYTLYGNPDVCLKIKNVNPIKGGHYGN